QPQQWQQWQMDKFLASFAFLKSHVPDTRADQLHYIWTSNALIAFSVLVSWKQFGGKPIGKYSTQIEALLVTIPLSQVRVFIYFPVLSPLSLLLVECMVPKMFSSA